MATKSKVKLFKQRVQEFGKLDKHSIYRDDLGNVSLKSELKDKIDKMLADINIEEQYLLDLPDNILQIVIDNLQDMRTTVERQRNRADDDYVNRRSDILANFNSRIDQINTVKPNFLIAKFDEIGIENLSKIKDEAKQIIDDLLTDAKNIRDAAAGEAIPQAQNDFSTAASSHGRQALFWGALSLIFSIAFIGFGYYLMETKVENTLGLTIIYYTAIRLTILFAIGAIITFCLRILRAQLHLREHDEHRARITNNIGPLITAGSEHQKDLILSILVQEIASFGKSGLLQKEDDSMSLSKNLIDNLTKNIISRS